MIRKIASVMGALAITLAAARPAQAHSYARDTYGSGSWPSALVERPLTLAEDLGQLDVPVTFNLTDGSVWKPVTMPLRLAYGFTSDVTVAVTHQTGCWCISLAARLLSILGRSRTAAASVIVASETSGGQSTVGGVNRPNVLKWSPIVPHVRRGSRYPAPHMLHLQRFAGTAGYSGQCSR